MYRSMMQAYVKGSKEAVEFYKRAFRAEVLCTYDDGKGGYMHSELNAYGQIIAVSELVNDTVIGNTMMFCFHFGEGGEENVKTVYEVLREDAITCTPLGKCDYSPLQFVCTDMYGITWCVFI